MGLPTAASTRPFEDGRTAEFRTFVRAGVFVALGFGLFEVAIGLAFADVGSTIAGATLVAYGAVVLARALWMLGRVPVEHVVRVIVLTIFIPIGVFGFFQPGVSLLVTILPIATAMAYLDARDMRLVTAISVSVAMLMILSMDLAPWKSTVPKLVLLPMHLGGGATVVLLVALLGWHFRSRLHATTAELSQLVDMSRELAQNVELTEVGNLTARYIAEAVEADECRIVYWDQAADRS